MSQLVQRIRKLPRFPKFDFDRFMGWVAYIIWFYSILCLLLVDLTLFDFAFLMPGSLAFWQEIFRSPPTIPLTISFMPKPEAGLYIAMLLLIGAGFLWFTYKCGKQAIVDFLAWKNFSYMRQLTLHHSIRRQLVFLYTLARFENERFHFAQQRKSGEIREKQLSDDNISSNDKIQCVGLFS
ncbi:MAG TPA: hypothetical protein VFV38_49325, partial [Ktedonobacteraceae bacterium]|nr:hypothetical protein [Ktedonobacteraceae bacterium]